MHSSVTAFEQAQNPAAASNDLNIVTIAKAMGDELRANILRVLANDSFGVMELCNIFCVAQPALSHHLKILKQAGLAHSRREGTRVFYQRAAFATSSLPAKLFAALDQTSLHDLALKEVEKIYTQRTQQSASFFENNADVLNHQSELICPPEVYIPYAVEIATQHISRKEIAPKDFSTLLEIGPGDCYLLTALAPLFDKALGIDTSRSMFEAGLKTLELTSAENITLQNKDFYGLPGETKVDVMVAAMVLHHMPSPNAFFQQVAKMLKQDGLLILVELCPHTQEKAKTLCGDLWLGFAPETLKHHAEKNGLSIKSQQFLAQRNGFRVQITSFNLLKLNSNVL